MASPTGGARNTVKSTAIIAAAAAPMPPMMATGRPHRGVRPATRSSMAATATGTTTPSTMKAETSATAAAMPNWVIDSMPLAVLARKAKTPVASASPRAGSTTASPRASARRVSGESARSSR